MAVVSSFSAGLSAFMSLSWNLHIMPRGPPAIPQAWKLSVTVHSCCFLETPCMV